MSWSLGSRLVRFLLFLHSRSDARKMNRRWIIIYPANRRLPVSTAPLFEDGVVRYTNRRVHPMKIFQSEPSDEVDRAWNETLEREFSHNQSSYRVTKHPTNPANEGMIHIHKSRAASLSRSVESWVDQDMVVYGVAAYHQLHCLDRIRQSFHPERYFPDEDEAMVIFHRSAYLLFFPHIF